MPQPPRDPAIVQRLKTTIEDCLRDGFSPPGIHGPRGSAAGETIRRLGTDRHLPYDFIRSARGTPSEPDWSLYQPPEASGYAVGTSGHVLKGESTLADADGRTLQTWTKTTRSGRNPDEVTHVPNPRRISKVSTLYDQDGNVTQQWVSERAEDAQREALWREIAAALAEPLPRVEPIPAPSDALSDDLLNVVPIGDHHTGMLSWPPETGAPYDLTIADRLLDHATRELFQRLPRARRCLIAVLGDYAHYDSHQPLTPTGKNLLDADSRYPKMIGYALRGLRRTIERAAENHDSVHVILEQGNHDPYTSVFLAMAFSMLYEGNPRIVIDTSPRNVHYYEFGKVLIGTTHGDKLKMKDLPLLMATDMPEAWGRSDYRYWLTGHVHHSETMTVANKDFGRVSVESFRVLPPTDWWAASNGYRSIRDMRGIVMHRHFGEIARFGAKPEMWAETVGHTS